MMFANKVAIITGASSGIGAAVAVEFARHGCSLALSGRNLQNLHRTRNQCLQAGLPADKILLVRGDVSEEEYVKNMVEETVRKFGRLDILVNNAGIVSTSSIIDDCDIAVYEDIMKNNTKSMLMVTKYSVPHLIRSKGAIVNVSSISGVRPMENVLFYCMSKAACDMFTRIISVELAKKGVRVNSVNPGVIKTNIHLNSGMSPEAYKEYMEMQKLLHPLGRYGDAEEVARAVRFLASEEASFIAGVVMPIDGARVNVTPRYAKL